MANRTLEHTELSTMLGDYKAAVEDGSRPSGRKRVSPHLIPWWRSLTIGNGLTPRTTHHFAFGKSSATCSRTCHLGIECLVDGSDCNTG